MEPKISVLVANDFPMIRNSMRELLNDTPNVRVIACTEAKSEVLPLADAHHPQVTILDLEVEWTGLVDLVTGLSDRKVPVLVMSDKFDDVKTFELLKTGANGVISRKIAPELLCRSVRAVASGEIWVSRTVVSQLVQQLRITPAEVSSLLRTADEHAASASTDFAAQAQLRNRFNLTPRESEMVRAIGEAMTNKDIAAHFGISEYTVKHHLTKIFDKVGVYSRLELAMFAIHHGLVERNSAAVAVA